MDPRLLIAPGSICASIKDAGDVCRPQSELTGEFRASRSDSGHADCLIILAILRAKLWVARKLLPKKRTFPFTVRSSTILPSRVMS